MLHPYWVSFETCERFDYVFDVFQYWFETSKECCSKYFLKLPAVNKSNKVFEGKETQDNTTATKVAWEKKRRGVLPWKHFPEQSLSHRNVNEQRGQQSRRGGILAPQVSSPEWGQYTVSQTSVGRGRDRQKECVCVGKFGEFLLVTWRKTAWLQFPAQAGKQLLKGGGKRGKERRREGEGGGLKVFPRAGQKHPLSLSQMHRLDASSRRWKEM